MRIINYQGRLRVSAIRISKARKILRFFLFQAFAFALEVTGANDFENAVNQDGVEGQQRRQQDRRAIGRKRKIPQQIGAEGFDAIHIVKKTVKREKNARAHVEIESGVARFLPLQDVEYEEEDADDD